MNDLRSSVIYYAWLILKNIIGWALILAALPVGVALPGPGGIPMFLIGFAMITFPGKRALTSRVMRGLPVSQDSPRAVLSEIVVALVIPSVLIWILPLHFSDQWQRRGPVLVSTVYAFSAVAGLVLIRLLVRLTNFALRFVPKIRRRVRPWMRGKGINLLPARRRHRLRQDPLADDKGILEVDDRYHNNVKSLWKKSKPWIQRIVSFGISIAILYYIAHKLKQHWHEVHDRVGLISWGNFAIASVMFAMFLFGVRAMSWRRIIKGFGHVLPIPAATRIWATSELARYVPGAVLQVYGRVHLARPYGVGGTECAASQILELIIFLLANILLGFTCLMFFGLRHVHGYARLWMVGLGAAVPFLMLLLYPPVFYSILDRILKWRKKPIFEKRLGAGVLFGLLLWAILGLLWQNTAVFLIISGPLQLTWSKWYVVAGAYSIAWCAGFIIVSAPAGIGVREGVLILTLHYVLPPSIKQQFASEGSLNAFLGFLGGLLRLWTIAGEFIVTSFAYLTDYRGALGRSPLQKRHTKIAASTPEPTI